jgi:hypothetical protein
VHTFCRPPSSSQQHQSRLQAWTDWQTPFQRKSRSLCCLETLYNRSWMLQRPGCTSPTTDRCITPTSDSEVGGQVYRTQQCCQPWYSLLAVRIADHQTIGHPCCGDVVTVAFCSLRSCRLPGRGSTGLALSHSSHCTTQLFPAVSCQ